MKYRGHFDLALITTCVDKFKANKKNNSKGALTVFLKSQNI